MEQKKSPFGYPPISPSRPWRYRVCNMQISHSQIISVTGVAVLQTVSLTVWQTSGQVNRRGKWRGGWGRQTWLPVKKMNTGIYFFQSYRYLLRNCYHSNEALQKHESNGSPTWWDTYIFDIVVGVWHRYSFTQYTLFFAETTFFVRQ